MKTEMVNLKGRIPLKLGHENDAKMKDGAPALGWVDRVWREGSKLLENECRNIHNIMYKLIRGLIQLSGIMG